MRVLCVRGLIAVATLSTALAQSGTPLPANYKTIFENADVLVQRVHYGPHEFVAMHDHPAAVTVFVYLNHSGVVDISHEDGDTVHRPPTQPGAFRISPGKFERHSVQNTSDLPSDFLRIELKKLTNADVPLEFRGAAPKEPYHSLVETMYDRPRLQIERVVCVLDEKCTGSEGVDAPSVLVMIPLVNTSTPKQAPLVWLPSGKDAYDVADIKKMEGHDEPYEILRLVLTKR